MTTRLILPNEEYNITERVLAGIAWLDGPEAPANWWNLVDCIYLDMRHIHNCLLAQLAQSVQQDDSIRYYKALEHFGLSYNDGVWLGFEVCWPQNQTPGIYKELTEAWKQVIKGRRGEL